jgi:LysM repeat protein
MLWRNIIFWLMLVALGLLRALPLAAQDDLSALIDPYSPVTGLEDMLDKVNALRESKGLQPLAINPELTAAAQEQADYISRTGNYAHEHNGSTPTTRSLAAGYQTTEWCCSENTHRTRVGKSAWEFWNFSPPHYRNMINPAWTEIGVAVSNVDEWTGWVLVFGSGIQLDGLVAVDLVELESPVSETYTVQYGDSVGSIAQRYNLPVEALIAANDIEAGSFIMPGDVLIVPR